SLRVDGRSWRKRSSRYSGNRTSHWRTHMRKDSDTVDDQLAVLRDDDSVPNVGGYLGQNSAEEFVAEYIDMDARRMTMDAGQSIYLFELGMNNPASEAHDMQDLVVIMTLTKAGGSTACSQGVAAASRTEFRMWNSASVQYSPEAIAKLGSRLPSIQQETRVVVAKNDAATVVNASYTPPQEENGDDG
ncbi:MAG: hypothetical protein R3247_14680, partial [Rhodothermales bacterium]|nr:hypothetical protein [Rhodothermales bacterium]